MKSGKRTVCCAAVIMFGAFNSTQAALYSRLDGQAYYDDELDITWLADANLAATQDFGVTGIGGYGPGVMNWFTAHEWLDAMNAYQGTGYLGFNDWHMPTVRPLNGTSFTYGISYDGTTDGGGYNISAPGTTYDGSTASDMAHLFATTLGNPSWYDTNGNMNDCAISYPHNCTLNTGPFSNIQINYWTDEISSGSRHYRFGFDFTMGQQTSYYRTNWLSVWAVHDGDVAVVPAPPALWLFGAGLVSLAAFSRHRKLGGKYGFSTK